jgi:hypothetical protein
MCDTKMILLPVIDEIQESAPAAFHELAAAKYLGMNRTAFRELVFAGLIPFSEHVNGKRRIYLRADLDRYLARLNWRRMPVREDSRAALKGVAK